jgi:beta-glucosidase
VTFYASDSQLPSFEEYSMKGRTYRYFSGKPLYGFGYGLSYTKFAYSNLKLSSNTVNAGDSLTVEADIRNAGSMDGDEVAELYLVPPASDLAPLRELESFERIHLAAGETKHVQFMLDPRRLSEVDAQGKRSVQPGTYSVFVGGQQPASDAGQSAAFTIQGTQELPR